MENVNQLWTLGLLNNIHLLYQDCEIGKGAVVDGTTIVNQCDVFEQQFGDSKYNYSLEFMETKMIEH